MHMDQHYFNGFTLTEQPVQAEGVKTIEIGSYVFTHSLDLTVSEYKRGRHLILAGYAVLEDDITLSAADILQKLEPLEQADREHLLNRLNGRYLLIIMEDELKVYPDATTMRPVFYHDQLPIAASHSSLVAEVAREHYNTPAEQYESNVNGYLDFSKYYAIYKLNPNTYLTLAASTATRFYPNQPFQTFETKEVLRKTIQHFEAMRKWLMTQETYLTITAGIDSRVSLAVMHDRALPLLTYNSLAKLSAFAEQAYANDLKIVQEMTWDLGLNHTLIDIRSNEEVSDETKAYSSQFESSHSYSLSEKKANSDFKGRLHIKSNIFELAKLPVVDKYYEQHDMSFVEVIKRKKPAALEGLSTDDMMAAYFKRADLTLEAMRGYHFPDLYYQEQRMGNWHSNVTQETDNSVDIFILLNTRDMLRLVTGASLKARKAKYLHREWINHFWPVLNFYAVNDGKNLYECYKEQYEELVISGHSIVIVDDEVMPKWPLIRPEVEFTVTNPSTVEKKMTLKSFYKNPGAIGTINLRINEAEYPYQELVSGHEVVIQPDETVTLTIVFNKLYDRESWQQAARLSIK